MIATHPQRCVFGALARDQPRNLGNLRMCPPVPPHPSVCCLGFLVASLSDGFFVLVLPHHHCSKSRLILIFIFTIKTRRLSCAMCLDCSVHVTFLIPCRMHRQTTVIANASSDQALGRVDLVSLAAHALGPRVVFRPQALGHTVLSPIVAQVLGPPTDDRNYLALYHWTKMLRKACDLTEHSQLVPSVLGDEMVSRLPSSSVVSMALASPIFPWA